MIKVSRIVTVVAWVTAVAWVQSLALGASACHGCNQKKRKRKIPPKVG